MSALTTEQTHAPRRVLVACIGNPDCGDDAVGPIVARELAGRLPADVTILVRTGDMLALIENWAGFDACVCVDAAAPIGASGRIHRIDLATDELPQDISLTSSHAFGIPEAVGLARALQRAPQDLIVYAVEGERFDGGTSPTPAVRRAASEVARSIVAEVVRLRNGSIGGSRSRGACREPAAIDAHQFGGHDGW